MKYGHDGKGPRRVRCPWAPNVLATPLEPAIHVLRLEITMLVQQNLFASVATLRVFFFFFFFLRICQRLDYMAPFPNVIFMKKKLN